MTVVVPVYNGAHIVPTTMPAVLSLDVEHIVYVDDGSTDGTPEALSRLASGDGRVRIVRHDVNRGRAAARNTGVAASEGDLILFLDADVEPAPGYAAAMGRALADQTAVATIAGQLTYPDARGAYAAYLSSGRRGVSAATASGGLIPWRHFLSGVAAIRRSAVEAVGGFDSGIEYGEDLALATRLWRRWPDGLRVAPEASVRLHDVGGLEEALANVKAFARGLARAYATNEDVLAVAGLERLVSRRLRDRGALSLARWRTPAAIVQRVADRLPRSVQPLAVRYLLGHTLARHVSGRLS